MLRSLPRDCSRTTVRRISYNTRVRIGERVRNYLNLVRFEHTIFALPFAYIGALFAWQYIETPLPMPGGMPLWCILAWLTVAVVAARTAAMAINRVVDARMDAANPRTAKREIPTGRVSVRDAAVLAVVSLIVLAFSTAMLSPRLLALLPIPAVFILGYSYTKRFTNWCHVILGATDGFAPLGGALAVVFATIDGFGVGSMLRIRFLAGPIFLGGLLLFAAVTLWVGGFDIYYSIQDIDFDRANGVFSIPATYGIGAGMNVALAMHAVTVVAMTAAGVLSGLTFWYFVGVAVAAGTLLVENLMVRRSHALIGFAFFTANGVLSVVVLIFTLASVAVQLAAA